MAPAIVESNQPMNLSLLLFDSLGSQARRRSYSPQHPSVQIAQPGGQ